MELILQSVECVPAKSVLSIKVGETKRQCLVSNLGQPFRFASSLAEPLPLKAEILSPLAQTQDVQLDPAATNIVLDFGNTMKVNLSQRHAPELLRPLTNVMDTFNKGIPGDRLDTAQTAAAYLEQHNLVRVFHDILHGLLVLKPTDPFAYLEDHVAKAKKLYRAASTANGNTSNRTPLSRSKTGMISCSKVDALLEILQQTRKNFPLIMPLLPEDLRNVLTGPGFAEECERQFRMLDTTGAGKLGRDELVPIIVELSTANRSWVAPDQVARFIKLFDANQDGVISIEEFETLTKFVVVAAHLETPAGQKLLDSAKLEEARFMDFIEVLENDKRRINDIVPFLPDWLVDKLTSDDFMNECSTKFDALDADRSGVLEPQELLPVVATLAGLETGVVTNNNLGKFVKIFDAHQNGVIMRDEFIDFTQFLAVMNFLSKTVEGQQVAQASLDFSNKVQLEEHIQILRENWKALPRVFHLLPKSLTDDISGNEFVKMCTGTFKYLSGGKEGVKLEASKLFHLIGKLCAEHPIRIDRARYMEIFGYFDPGKSGVISEEDVIEFARYVVVTAYLICCKEWHDSSIQNSKERIQELLDYLKQNARKIGNILTYLPQQMQQDLMSNTFEEQCMQDFKAIDTDNSGSLEGKELIPLILQLSEGHKLALTSEHVNEFLTLFDTLGNGVITPGEFVNMARFMMILAYLETEEGNTIDTLASEISGGTSQVDNLLKEMRKDNNTIHKVIPFLPQHVYNNLTSDDFVMNCQERFRQLDVDRNGTLSPPELHPVLVELSQARPYEISIEQCVQFTEIFDIRGDGVLRADEFLDFARFLLVMSYLESDEGGKSMGDALAILESSRNIDELVETLEKDRRQMNKVMPYLPEGLQKHLLSTSLTSSCLAKFDDLDKDKSGFLDPEELYPLILELTEAHQYALDLDQCKKFTSIFDEEKRGVINKTDFVNFARFLLILSFLSTDDGKKTLAIAEELTVAVGPAPAQIEEIATGKKRVKDVLAEMKKDRDALQDILPVLPADVFNSLTSNDFLAYCHEEFGKLDKDRNGTLEPAELHPVIVRISAAHPYAISLENCKEFTAIFDSHGDGVIHEDEFVDFARFLCVMEYLQSSEGQQKVDGGLEILESSKRIDDLIELLQKDRRQMHRVVPYLPDKLRDELLSADFAKSCMMRFQELDKDGNGTLEPKELFPVMIEMTNARKYALNLDQCERFTAIFDDERTGVISKKEFLSFARFLMVMSFLQTEDGKRVLAVATQKYKEEKQARKEARQRKHAKRPPAPTPTAQTMHEVAAFPAMDPPIDVTASGDAHVNLELDFYRGRAEKLNQENDILRNQMRYMEETLRQMEIRMDEQDQRLRHAEVDLRKSGLQLR